VLPYDPTYGRRYIFADLEQRTFEMGVRMDWTFSPTLSLQVYAQPLLSAGDYVTYKQLAAAETYDFVDLGPSDPSGTQSVDFDGDGTADFTFEDQDFNVRSLIGNAVLRWEYRPGSTMFLVWTQERSGRVTTADGSLDLGTTWDQVPENIFLAKISYYFTR
jgi:hypothetical protein